MSLSEGEARFDGGSGNDGRDDDEQQNGDSHGTAGGTTTIAQENERKRLENQILMELSATVNTLTSISNVLDDISTSSQTVSHKQEALLQELQRWKDTSHG